MSGRDVDKQRLKLFTEQKGLCYWCKQPMRILKMKPHKPAPPDLCTIDHLEPKFHPQRGTFAGKMVLRRVAACRKCNNERDKEQQAKIPRHIIQKASHQGIKARQLARMHADELKEAMPLLQRKRNE